jgi:hypothetical protein
LHHDAESAVAGGEHVREDESILHREGTSFATRFVAGRAALLLHGNASLNNTLIRPHVPARALREARSP